MCHLQIILLKILNYQKDRLCILRRAKVQVLSPAELLPGFVTNLRTDHWQLLSETYHSEIFEQVCGYGNPSCQALSKAFKISKKFALT